MRRPVRVLLGSLTPALIAAGLIYFGGHSPSDGETARGVVERTYETARTAGLTELTLCRRDMEDLEARFGRVREFRVLGGSWSWKPHTYLFEVEVERAGGRTRELAEATSGPSQIHGHYVSPCASSVRLAR